MSERKKNITLLIWAIFLGVLMTHALLAKKWCDLYLVKFFNNSSVFMDAVSLAYHQVITGQSGVFDLSVFSQHTWAGVGGYWPPLATMTGVWSLLVLPVHWFFMLNLLYLALIMLGIYFTTRLLISSRFYSMLAAVIFSCYWFVIIQLVGYDVQLAAAACTVWAFYWYFRSDHFNKLWPSFMVGAFLLLALYCDHLNPALFILPLFLVPENFRSKRSLLVMAAVVLVVAICAWPHYFRMFCDLFGSREARLFTFSQGQERVPPMEAYRIVLTNPYFTFSHIFYYIISFPERIIGIGFSFLLIMGAWLLRRLNKPEVRVIWLAVIVPLVIATLIIKKSYIYIFPLCLWFAIITAVGISLVRSKLVKGVLILAVIVLAVLPYVGEFTQPEWYFIDRNYFSSFFSDMEERAVPKMLFATDAGMGNGPDIPVFAILQRIVPGLRATESNEPGRGIIVDCAEYQIQHALVFRLSYLFPKDNIINGAFYVPQDDRAERAQHLYLITEKTKYTGDDAVKTFGGATWKKSELLYREPDTDVVL